MAFNNYLEDENDKPYFKMNSLAYYYDKMEGFAEKVEQAAKVLNVTKEEVEKNIAAYIEQNKNELDQRLAQWDGKLETFDSSVETLLSEWVDDGTLIHVIDSTLIDQKIVPLTAQLAETQEEMADKTYTKSVNPLRNIVTFYFDDAPKADLTVIKPMADARGVPMSICAIVEYVKNSATYMDIDQLKTLEDEGWSVEPHTYNHPRLDTLTDEQIETELKTSKEFFNSNGMYPTALVYPEGRYDNRVLRIMRKYYDAGIASVQGKNTSPINQFVLRRILVDAYTIEQLKTMVDSMNNEWYIFYSHTTTDFIANHKAKFEALMDYIVYTKKIEVLNFKEALKVFRNRIDIGDTENKTFKVGANGQVDIGNLNYEFLGKNSGIKNTTSILNFPKNKVSIAAFNSVENSGIPYGNGIGTLITYRVHDDDALSYQEFIPYNSSARYSRRWINNEWGMWTLITPDLNSNPVVILDGTSGITKDTPISSFASKKITYITFLSGQSNFPFSSGIGTLMTVKLSDEHTLSYQVFYEFNSKRWHRRRWEGTTWGVWVTYSGDIDRIQTTQAVVMGSIPANSNANLTLTVTGLKADRAVSVSLLGPVNGLIIQPYATAADTLVLNVINTTSSALTLNTRSLAITQ